MVLRAFATPLLVEGGDIGVEVFRACALQVEVEGLCVRPWDLALKGTIGYTSWGLPLQTLAFFGV